MKVRLIVLAVAMGILLSSSAVHAEMGKKKEMSMQNKLMKKYHVIFQKSAELAVSKKQLEKIKVLKISMKKELIRKTADIEVVAVDIKAMMYDKEIDIKAVNSLIDKKYEIKKAKAKMLVKSCADLRAILTDKQKDKLKSIMKSKEKYGQGCMMCDKHKKMKKHGK